MNLNEVRALSDEELKTTAAKLMGWEQRTRGVYNPEGKLYYEFADPRSLPPHFRYEDVIPDYPNDIAAAWELGSVVDREVFGRALELIIWGPRSSFAETATIDGPIQVEALVPYGMAYSLAQANPRKRTRAFILAMTQEG